MAGFIKFQKTKLLDDLFKYPNEFTLLAVIAYRAKRTTETKRITDVHLEQNQALIGDYKNYGMTERGYRTAKLRLKKWNLATFKATSKGTIATIINTDVFDINAEQSDEQSDRQATNMRRTGDEQVTTNKNVNKDKNVKNDKETNAFFEECWKMYPRKKGKGQIKKSCKIKIYKLGDEFKRCIERYKEEISVKQTPEQYIKMGSTFFNSGYEDYLDENYEKPSIKNPKNGSLPLDDIMQWKKENGIID